MSPERAPAMPEDLDDRLSRVADMTATQEIDGARVAAIGGFAVALDGLAKYHRTVDQRGEEGRLWPAMWLCPPVHSRVVADRLGDIKLDIDLALYRFRCGHRGPTSESLASVIVSLVAVASDLGLDLGEALGWVIPVRPSGDTEDESSVVADQAAS